MIKKEWKELTGITNTLAHDLSLDEKINIEDMTCNELKILYKHDNGLLYNNAFFNDNTNIGYVNPKKITKSILTANNFGGKTSKCRVNFYYNMILKNNILDGDWDIKDIIKSIDLIVNCTPLGMNKKDPLPIDAKLLHKGLKLYDVVYNPLKTVFVIAACKKGIKASNGLGMLLYQGALAFELWTGQKAPISLMKKELISNLI